MFERDYRDLAFVPRWAITPVNHRQSVAEHSFYVAVYAAHIVHFYRECGFQTTNVESILTHAILHDRSEAFMSDIPGPVKRSISGKETRKRYEIFMTEKAFNLHYDILPEAEAIVKVADLMDEYAYWRIEISIGNRFNGIEDLDSQIADRLHEAAKKLPYLTDEQKGELLERFFWGADKPKTIPENNNDVVA